MITLAQKQILFKEWVKFYKEYGYICVDDFRYISKEIKEFISQFDFIKLKYLNVGVSAILLRTSANDGLLFEYDNDITFIEENNLIRTISFCPSNDIHMLKLTSGQLKNESNSICVINKELGTNFDEDFTRWTEEDLLILKLSI